MSQTAAILMFCVMLDGSPVSTGEVYGFQTLAHCEEARDHTAVVESRPGIFGVCMDVLSQPLASAPVSGSFPNPPPRAAQRLPAAAP